MEQITELAEAATAALIRFDTERLQELGDQAQALRALLGPGQPVAEIPARLRVFAEVLRGTQENLRILGRVRRA